MQRYIYFGLLLLAAVAGCREPYELPLNNPPTGYLVVEGFINSDGPTTIRLSRTVPLEDTARILPERSAQLIVQGRNGEVIPLSETGPGTYTGPSRKLATGTGYRLFIRARGKEYASAYTPVRTDPPLDSVRWAREPEGLRIFADSRDREGDNQYFLWDYEETWEFHSRYPSELKFEVNSAGQTKAVYRTGFGAGYDPSIFFCWNGSRSTRIMTGNSVNLERDEVRYPLLLIPNGSEKLSVLYHIRVRQYALDKGGYEFFELLRKNTEDLGSIFDPQPSEIRGNIQPLSDPQERVIGYVMVTAIRERSRFIRVTDIPDWTFNAGCAAEVQVVNNPDSLEAAASGGLVPTFPTEQLPNGNFPAVFAAEERCVDCTTRGTNRKPSFWP